jgi:PAS domain S-box-containing protein
MVKSQENAAEVAELRARLKMTEEALEATRAAYAEASAKTRGTGLFSSPADTHDLCRVLVENMSEGAVVLAHDGTIIYGNDRFAEMARLDPGQVIGARLREFFPGDERERFQSLFGPENPAGGRGEFTMSAADGGALAVHVSGRRVDVAGARGMCMVISDISVRKRAEEVLLSSHEELERRVEERTMELTGANGRLRREAREREQAEIDLREREEHFRLLIENALDIIMVLRPDGAIAYAGPSLKRLLGYKAGETISGNFLDFVRPGARASLAERFIEAGRIPGFTISFEAELKGKNGEWRTIEMIGRNLLHEKKVAGFVVNGRDVTGRRLMEERLRRAHDDLEARVEERTGELRRAYERLEIEIRSTARRRKSARASRPP